MPDPARTLVVIPARAESKRLPRKNVLPLGGKPLILHAVDVALTAAPFGRVLVSTDDPEIKTVALSRKGVTVDDRADILAGDKVKVVDVIGELTDRTDIQRDFDIIGMLLPTCPFRTAPQIRDGFDSLSPDCDAVISFTTYEFPPILRHLRQEGRHATVVQSFAADHRQYPLPGFRRRPIGPTAHSSYVDCFVPSAPQFLYRKVKGATMPRLNSVDIDDGQDFAYAQFLIERPKSQFHKAAP